MTDEVIDSYISLRHGAVRPQEGSKEAWIIKNYGRFLPEDLNSKIIEIGPGLGENVDLFVNKLGFKNVDCIDNSSEVIENIKNKLNINGQLNDDLVNFFTNIPAETYDLVIMFHVIEHLPKPEINKILKAIRKSIKKGGVLLIETPNMENPLTASMHRYHDFTHQLGFTGLSLIQILRGAGFNSVEVFPVRPKVSGILRIFQLMGQLSIEYVMSLLMRFYNPGYKSNAMSQYVGACAIK